MRHFFARYAAPAALVVCAVLFVPAAAEAESDASDRPATDLLPGASNVAVHLDVDRLKDSKYFDRALDFLETRMRERNNYSKFFDSEKGYHLGKDVSRVAVGVPNGRINPRAPEFDRGVMVVDGNFTAEKTRKLVEQGDAEVTTRKVAGDLEVHEVEGTEFTVLSGGRLVVVTGPDAYRETAWKTVAGESASFEKVSQREKLLQHVDTDRTLWVVNRAGGTTKSGQSIRSTTLSFDLDDGAALQLVSRTGTESGAKAMIEQMAALKKTGRENTMIQMLGAAPLVENLSWERRGTSVVATTSMNAEQLEALVEMTRQTLQSTGTSMPGAAPATEGKGKKDQTGSDTGAEKGEGSDDKDDKDASGDDSSSSDGEGDKNEEGVNADFN